MKKEFEHIALLAGGSHYPQVGGDNLDNFGKILGMTHLYYNLIEEQLDRFNLPLELKHLAIVESALNPNATSITGAAGIWQFMMPTGKMFGLNINSFLDDRRDPLRSTIAACKYFKYFVKSIV
jgi:soluble lytic murein transglycosylase-like protein